MTMEQKIAAPCTLNGEALNFSHYPQFHRLRIQKTLETLRRVGAQRILEVGGHPWWMTSCIIDDPDFELSATVSAEEVTDWPEDIGVTPNQYTIKTENQRIATFVNYSANVERTLFSIDEQPDAVLACEIIEHLIRSPHIMLLNINRWLPLGGKLIITTPNGAQFANPFRRRTRTPAYRCNVYSRHNYVYTLSGLVDLVSLCGFRIVEAEYWDVYERRGLSKVYGLINRLPHAYFREKFRKTLCVLAEKNAHVKDLSRIPRVYYPDHRWEFISSDGEAGDDNQAHQTAIATT